MQILILSNQSKVAEEWKQILISIHKIDVRILKLNDAKKYLLLNKPPDIIVLDTDNENDLYLCSQVDCASPLVVISSTIDLCLPAFAFNTFNYLIKPVQQEDFEQSLVKYQKYYQKNVDTDFMGDLQSLVEFVSKKEKEYKKRFMIKIGNTIKSVSVKEIAYFYSQDKVNYLMQNNGKKFPVESSLDEIEAVLNPENFYRANRQYIININAIEEIHPYFKGRVKLNLSPAQSSDLIISSEKSRNFKDWLNK